MARVTIEDVLARVHDQFAVVHLAAQRYRQLHRGAKRLAVPKNKENKDIVQALREIAAGKVRFREDVHSELMHPHPVRRVQRRMEEPSQEFTEEMNSNMNVFDEDENSLI